MIVNAMCNVPGSSPFFKLFISHIFCNNLEALV